MPTLTFTSGNDTYEVTAAGSFNLTFLAGNDTLTLRHSGATTIATMGDGADVVSHRAGIANVDGDAGSDRFEIYASGLTADGGADGDLFNIRSGSGLDLAGGLGVDRFNFYGPATSVLVHGGDGSDDFFGYNQAISGNIYGESGNDYFVLFRGAITLHGGSGNDIFRADATAPATFIENAGAGTDSVQVARGDTYTLPANIENISVQGFSGSSGSVAGLVGNDLSNTIVGHNNVETIFGEGGNDRLSGKGENDTISGGDGNDFLDGGDGNDHLSGESGNDTLQGRAGDDDMAGGTGNDTYYVDSLADLVAENVGEGTDLARVAVANYQLPSNVENGFVFGAAGLQLVGNELDNLLIGGPGNDLLLGQEGNDTVKGGGGDDTLAGTLGNDTVDGGDGDDIITGANLFNDSNDNDVLIGGLGQDRIVTGSGSDIVLYRQTFEALFDSVGRPNDEVSDFDVAFDRFDFSAIDADINQDGIQAFHFTGATWDGLPGDIWLEHIEGDDYYLYAEVNDDQFADMAILIHLPGGADSFTIANLIL